MPTKPPLRQARKRASAIKPPKGKQKSSATSATASPLEPNRDETLQLVMQMMSLPGLSGREGLVAQFIMDQLRQAGRRNRPLCSTMPTAARQSPAKSAT